MTHRGTWGNFRDLQRIWGLGISPHGKFPCCSEHTEKYTPTFQEVKKVNGMNMLRIPLAVAEIRADKLRLP